MRNQENGTEMANRPVAQKAADNWNFNTRLTISEIQCNKHAILYQYGTVFNELLVDKNLLPKNYPDW